MIKYSTHTQKIPPVHPGEHPLIAFLPSMAASMAAKEEKTLPRRHEPRGSNPMNGICGMVNLLLEIEFLPDQREHLETIQS